MNHVMALRATHPRRTHEASPIHLRVAYTTLGCFVGASRAARGDSWVLRGRVALIGDFRRKNGLNEILKEQWKEAFSKPADKTKNKGISVAFFFLNSPYRNAHIPYSSHFAR